MIKCKKCNKRYTYEYSIFSKKKEYKPACSCVKNNKIKPLDAAFKKLDEWLKNGGLK